MSSEIICELCKKVIKVGDTHIVWTHFGIKPDEHFHLKCYGHLDIPTKSDSDWLNSEEFYSLMQTYRNASILSQSEVIKAYEAVKQYIRSHISIKG